MDRKPRLLFIGHEALFFTTHRLPIARALVARGVDVHVAAPLEDDAPRAKIAAAGCTFHPIPLNRGGRNPLAELKLVASLWRLIRDLKPDLTHHVSLKPVVWGGPVARLANVPAAVFAVTGLGYFFIRRGMVAAAYRALIKALFRFALHHRNSVTIFQNGDDRDLFVRSGLVEAKRVAMIAGCGVDLGEFAATPEPDGVPVVMFPARLLGDKGVNEFVGAAEILKREEVNARFVLVGRRDPINPTDIGEARLHEWVARGTVEYRGFSADMPATLAQANIIVLPSYREGLPRGLIEASACARAIVTTDVTGCRDVVRDGENGLLVPVGDAAATADAIRRLLADPALRHRLAARGRAIAEAEFSVEGFVARSLDAYRRVLPEGALP